MIDGLRAGEQVDFGDLGKFRLQITSRGAETAEKFTATTSPELIYSSFRAEDLKTIFSGLEFSPVPTRAATRLLLKAQKAGQTTVDFSKTAHLPVEIPAVNRMTVATPVAEDWMKTRWDRI